MKRSMLLLASAMLVVAVVGCRGGMGFRQSEPCCGGADFSGPTVSSYPSYDEGMLMQPSGPTTQILPSPR